MSIPPTMLLVRLALAVPWPADNARKGNSKWLQEEECNLLVSPVSNPIFLNTIYSQVLAAFINS